MLDQFSATIEKLYAASADPIQWPEALQALEELSGSVGAVIGFVPKRPDDQGFNLAGRFTDQQCATYTAQYQPICRRTRHMIEHPEVEIHYDALLITEREMDTDPVYDWFGKHDLRYFVGCALPETRDYRPVFTLQRSPRQGHVQEADISLFDLISPHVSKALALADQLGTLRTFGRFSAVVLNAMPQAVFAIDKDGRVIFANSAAEAVLNEHDGLAILQRTLVTDRAAEQSRLNSIIVEALSPPSSTSSGWARISKPSGHAPYAVFAAPLDLTDEELTTSGAKVLLFVHDLASQPNADPEMLSSVFGLTEAEARMAVVLAGGQSIESAAAMTGVQPSTARAHLKAIFHKTGVHRQQDLVRILTSLSLSHL
jgi:DNA-binding CsgD family transcriptional regulator/PAS domain-containing protein